MKESDTLEVLQQRKTKWDKIVNGLKIALGFYAFLVLTYLAVQGVVAQNQIANVLDEVEATTTAVREAQVAGQKTGTQNHEKTRQYIECLFTEVLTVPLADRTNVDFETCTRQVDTESKNTDTQQGSNNATPVTPAPASPQTNPNPAPSVNPKPDEPVATAPPDPEPEDDRSALGRLPLLGGLFQALGL